MSGGGAAQRRLTSVVSVVLDQANANVTAYGRKQRIRPVLLALGPAVLSSLGRRHHSWSPDDIHESWYVMEAKEVLFGDDDEKKKEAGAVRCANVVAATRWLTQGNAVDQYFKNPAAYAMALAVNTRHGRGDVDGDRFVIDAGALNITAAGIATQLCREETVAAGYFLQQVFRILNPLIANLQSRSLSYEGYEDELNRALMKLRALTTTA